MENTRAQLIRQNLPLLVMWILWKESDGYPAPLRPMAMPQIDKDILTLHGGGISEKTLYSVLHRLKKKGMIKQVPEMYDHSDLRDDSKPSNAPLPIPYALTPQGRAYVDLQRIIWRELGVVTGWIDI